MSYLKNKMRRWSALNNPRARQNTYLVKPFQGKFALVQELYGEQDIIASGSEAEMKRKAANLNKPRQLRTNPQDYAFWDEQYRALKDLADAEEQTLADYRRIAPAYMVKNQEAVCAEALLRAEYARNARDRRKGKQNPRARRNAKSDYWLTTDNGRTKTLWHFHITPGKTGSLKRLKFLQRDHSMFQPLWPAVLRAASADAALDKSIQFADDEDQMSRNAFQGGFVERTGRLSGGTSQALREVRIEAQLYELLSYLISSWQSFGMSKPPMKVGSLKIRYLDEWDMKMEMAPTDRERNKVLREKWAAEDKRRR
jgi:hypothetical protein